MLPKDHEYHLTIDECQRRIITTALQALSTNAVQVLDSEPGTGTSEPSEYMEYKLLTSMFQELLYEEERKPGQIHGLNL